MIKIITKTTYCLLTALGLLIFLSTSALAEDFTGYYKLQNDWTEAFDECFEGNRVDAGATLDGAAFMAPCANITDQLW